MNHLAVAVAATRTINWAAIWPWLILIVAALLVGWPLGLRRLWGRAYARPWAAFYAWRARSWAAHAAKRKAGAK